MAGNADWLDSFIEDVVHQSARDLALTLFVKAQESGVTIDTRVQNEVIGAFITVFTLVLAEKISESLNT